MDHTFYKNIKGSFHLWKDECIFKMGNLCRRNVKLFLNLELSRLRKAKKKLFLAHGDERQQGKIRENLRGK